MQLQKLKIPSIPADQLSVDWVKELLAIVQQQLLEVADVLLRSDLSLPYSFL
jgi:hypothetical protein